VKEEFKEEEKKDDFEDNIEETQKEVQGERLVLRRILSGQKGAKDKKRENIFHSRCTV